MQQYYKIAGLIVEMNTFGRTADLAIPYRIENGKQADMVLQAPYRQLKELYPEASVDKCEYIIKGREFYQKLIDFDGMLLHAAAVVWKEKAYLFTADSHVGKTTHTSLWRCLLGDDNVKILNDDKPALRLEDGIWYAYGTPWCGKNGLNLNLKYPVAGICFLKQGRENIIESYEDKNIVYQFLKQTSSPSDTAYKLKQLSLIENLIENVPIWFMKCNMDLEAAKVSCQAMSGEKI